MYFRMPYIPTVYLYDRGIAKQLQFQSFISNVIAINQNKLLPIQIEPHIQALHKQKQAYSQYTNVIFLIRAKCIIVSKYSCGSIIYLHKARYGALIHSARNAKHCEKSNPNSQN